MARNGAKELNKKSSDGGLGAVPAVGAYLDVSRSKVYQMMESGDLPYVKLGKSRRIPWSAVFALVEANTVGARD